MFGEADRRKELPVRNDGESVKTRTGRGFGESVPWKSEGRNITSFLSCRLQQVPSERLSLSDRDVFRASLWNLSVKRRPHGTK